MKDRICLVAFVVLVVLASASAAEAQVRPRCYAPTPAGMPVDRAGRKQGPCLTYPFVPAARPAPSQLQVGGDYGGAVAVINAARAARGRMPLSWSPALASWAAANRGVHGVLAPGAGQCQAWHSDPVSSAHAWLGSTAHYSILMAANQEIGISVSADGSFTANVR